jgi:iron complex outermembrane receptor protein
VKQPQISTPWSAACWANTALRLGLSLAAALGFAMAPLPIAAQPSESPSDSPSAAEEETNDDDLFGDESADEGDSGPTATPAAPATEVEEIVIKGKAGPGIEIDAAVSVTSFDAEDLQAMGVEDVSDLARFTPNLEIRTAGATTATFFIRGVGLNDFTANAAGSVAVYQDDVALNLPAIQLGQVFDVQGIEVLKGPQGSGPGRNATAGVIQVHTRKPTGEIGGSLRFDRGNFGYIDTEGSLEVPLWDDVLSTRMAFRITKRDGLVDNRCGGLSQEEIDGARPAGRPCGNDLPSEGDPGIVPGLPTEFNDLDTWAARIQLRYLPPDTSMDWLLNLHGGKIDQRATVGSAIGTASGFFGSATSDSYTQPEIRAERNAIFDSLGGLTPGCAQDPDCRAIRTKGRAILGRRLASGRPLDTKPFEGDYNLPGYEKQDSFGGFLRGEWDLANFSFTTITGYESYDRDRLIDADYTSKRNFEFVINDDAWQFTQDFRLAGELDTFPLAWSAGAYYLMEELDYDQETLVGRGSEVRPLTQIYRQRTWSFAVYGGFLWNFLDDFELDAGIRYNWERKTFDTRVLRGAADKCVSTPLMNGGATLAADCTERVSVGDPTGSVSLKYFFDEEVSAYLKYNRGWKSTQLNVGDGFDNLAFTQADTESIDSFEAGFHATWLDGRLDVGGALFWYSYEDYQVFLFTNDFGSPPQRVVRNASDAQLYGAELEIQAAPIELLELTARFSWLESKFLDFADSGVRQINLGIDADPPVVFTDVPIEYTGNRLPNTPRFTFSGSAQYTVDMGGYGFLVPRYDFSWTDDVFFDPSEGRGAPNVVGDIFLPDFAIGQKAYWLHNFRLAYRTADERIELAGWVRNLTNEVYKTIAFDASAAAGLVGNLVGDPRTYGVSLSVSF